MSPRSSLLLFGAAVLVVLAVLVLQPASAQTTFSTEFRLFNVRVSDTAAFACAAHFEQQFGPIPQFFVNGRSNAFLLTESIPLEQDGASECNANANVRIDENVGNPSNASAYGGKLCFNNNFLNGPLVALDCTQPLPNNIGATPMTTDPTATGLIELVVEAASVSDTVRPAFTYQGQQHTTCANYRQMTRTVRAVAELCDGNGQDSESVVANFVITDVTAPILSISGSGTQTLECGDSSVPSFTATATDNCGAAVDIITQGAQGDVFTCSSTRSVTVVATDDCGNAVSDVYEWSVQDTTVPQLSFGGASLNGNTVDVTITCTELASLPATTSQTVTGNTLDGVTVTDCNTVSLQRLPGVTIETCPATGHTLGFSYVYEATDACGRSAQGTVRYLLDPSATPLQVDDPSKDFTPCQALEPPPAFLTTDDTCSRNALTQVGADVADFPGFLDLVSQGPVEQASPQDQRIYTYAFADTCNVRTLDFPVTFAVVDEDPNTVLAPYASQLEAPLRCVLGEYEAALSQNVNGGQPVETWPDVTWVPGQRSTVPFRVTLITEAGLPFPYYDGVSELLTVQVWGPREKSIVPAGVKRAFKPQPKEHFITVPPCSPDVPLHEPCWELDEERMQMLPECPAGHVQDCRPVGCVFYALRAVQAGVYWVQVDTVHCIDAPITPCDSFQDQSCCEPGNAGVCTGCQNCVCERDVYCCEVEFDEICVAQASEACGVNCDAAPHPIERQRAHVQAMMAATDMHPSDVRLATPDRVRYYSTHPLQQRKATPATKSAPKDRKAAFAARVAGAITGSRAQIIVHSSYAVLARGDCRGLTCCYLVQDCICDLTANLDHELHEHGWRWDDVLCPFKICGYGYTYDSRQGLCTKHRGLSHEPVQHEPYHNLKECLSDYTRASSSWCTSPLENAWLECKLTAGFR